MGVSDLSRSLCFYLESSANRVQLSSLGEVAPKVTYPQRWALIK